MVTHLMKGEDDALFKMIFKNDIRPLSEFDFKERERWFAEH
jgi:hypothetical protein